jgi:hypothetical protein
MAVPGCPRCLQKLFCRPLHCFFSKKGEKKPKKKRKKQRKDDFPEGRLVFNAQALGAVISFKKLILGSVIVIYVHPIYWRYTF